MSIYLRVILILMSVLATVYALRQIRKSQMKIENAIFWFLFVVVILILSIFPEIAMILARLLGIESPVNLIYLAMIFLLIVKVFSQSVKFSQMEHKIGILTAEIAILRNKLEGKDDEKSGDHSSL